MGKIISILMITSMLAVSPMWPLGENPQVGDPYIIINKKINRLAFINHASIQKVYPIATGKTENLTPEGEFTIVVKVINPYYRKKNIPGGAKNNPLGTRWLGFDADNTNGRTFGIHGNSNPPSIGHYITAGCVRMHEQDVQALYHKIPLGTKVLIVSTAQSFEELGKKHGALSKSTT